MRATLSILFASTCGALLNGPIWSSYAWSTDIHITRHHLQHKKQQNQLLRYSAIHKNFTAKFNISKGMQTPLLKVSNQESILDNEGTNESNEQPHGIKSMKEFLMPMPKCNPSQMSPTSLAYIGDSVFELFVRTRYVWPTRRTAELQKLVVAKVRAETQSIILQSLLSKFEFTSDEQTILSRGRNAGSSSGGRKRGPKRLYSSNKTDESGGPRVYQDSTAIEALLGYVYLTDEKRCVEIMEFISAELDQMDEMEGVVR